MVRFLRDTGTKRPMGPTGALLERVQPGDSIGVVLPGGAGPVEGTLGLCVRRLTDTAAGATLLLSNSHVIAGEGTLAVDHPVYSPGPVSLESALPATAEAALDSFAPILETPAQFPREEDSPQAFRNRVDAALARLSPGQLAARSLLPPIGPLADATVEPAHVWMHVQKVGAVSGWTTAEVTDVAFAQWVGGYVLGQGDEYRFFEGALRLRADPGSIVAEPGDSGSLAVDQETRRGVGLLFAASADGSEALANPLDEVLAALGVTPLL